MQIKVETLAGALAAAALMLLCAGTASAGPVEKLGPIVVTPTRVPTPESNIANSVEVITADEIARKQYSSVAAALGALSGLQVVRSGSPGQTTAIFARGTNANHTLVLIDGIEFNDPSTPDGRADLSGIAIDDVAQIEVLYGSQGTLYGSDAIGAVVNIVTKKGRGPARLTASAEAGSFDTYNQSASLSGGTERIHYMLSAQHRFTGGLSATTDEFAPPGFANDDDDADIVNISGKAGLALFDNLSVDVAGRYVNKNVELDLNVFPIQSDNDARLDDEAAFVRADARLDLLDGRTKHRLGVAYSRFDRLTTDTPDPINPLDSLRDKNVGDKLKVDLQNDLHLIDGHVFTLGLETEEQSIDASLVSTSLFGPFTSSAADSVTNNAVYLQDQFSLFGRIDGTAGVRLDDHETFGSATTYRFAAAYNHLETGSRLRGAYGTGFRAPSLVQLFGSSISGFGVFTGNPNLKPERSEAWEIGFDQALLDDRVRVGATYFETEVKDLIEGTATTNVNIGLAEITGYEIYARAEIDARTSVQAKYTHLRPRDTQAGQDLLRRPRDKASADLSYAPADGVTLSAELVYVGRQFDVDAATFARIRLDDHVLLNLHGQYRLTDTVLLFARVENALDTDYEQPDGFTQPGVGAFAGIKMTLP